MHDFMGFFLIVFSMFKFFDIEGFADGFQMYDLLAKPFRGYAYLYPFIELGLGLAYLAHVVPRFIYAATIAVMVFGSLGVLKALRKGLDLECACMAAASAATHIANFGTRPRGTLVGTVTFLLAAVCLCGTPACQSASGRRERYPAGGRAASQRATPVKPKPDLRELRPRLLGRSMQGVLAMLGKPETVVTLGGGLESWDYINAAYDSITGRPVGVLTVWFQDRKVERITASF